MEFKGRFTRIKGLSDVRRLPRLGKIRLGVKMVSLRMGREYPKETDYFVVPPEVAKVYGEKPTELEVMVPLNDVEAVFPQAYKWYGESKGLKCVGDGETAMRLSEETRAMVERKCPCELLESGACQRRAHLMVLLPRVNLGGVYQVDVGSYHSIVDINSGLDYIQALVGRIAMVPLRLRRVPRETHANGQRQVHYTLQINLDADVDTLNTLRENTRNVLLSTKKIVLPLPEDSNPAFDDGAVVVIDEEGVNAPKGLSGGTPDVPDVPKDVPKNIPKNIPKDVFAESPMTPQQAAAIVRLAVKNGIPEEETLRQLQGLTKKQAAEMIVALQKGAVSVRRDTQGEW